MKPPSFESLGDNPYVRKPDSTEEPLDVPKKEASKKEKDRKNKGDKKHENEKEQKKEKKPVEEEDKKKPPKKPEKEKQNDEEALEEKKQRRQSLIERSLNYKKLYEEMPIPHDPWVVARLMVAEHILAIQGQIEEPAADATSLDELRILASLDYMGSIADTLENPNVETTPEIQETCDTLVQLAQEALDEGGENITETLVANNNDAAQAFDQDPQKVPEHDASLDLISDSLPISGAALLAVLTHIRHRSHQQTPPPDPTARTTPPVTGGGGGSGGRPSTAAAPQAQGDGHAAPSTLNIPPRDTSFVAPERHTTSPEAPFRHAEQPIRSEVYPIRSSSSEPLAAFVVATALAAPRTSIYKRPVVSNAPAQQRNAHEIPHLNGSPGTSQFPEYTSSYVHPAPLAHIETAAAAHTTNVQSSSETISHLSSKIEHLPLVSLLAMAETVSIGHGQRLRSAYEKGSIDKEGLVKILKSHAKHQDFIQEYKQQVVKRRNLIQSSPEFLSSQSKKDTGGAISEATAHEPVVVSNDFQPDKNILDFVPASDLPRPQEQPASVDPFDTPDEKIFHPAWLVPVLIGVLILVVGILLAFLILQ